MSSNHRSFFRQSKTKSLHKSNVQLSSDEQIARTSLDRVCSFFNDVPDTFGSRAQWVRAIDLLLQQTHEFQPDQVLEYHMYNQTARILQRENTECLVENLVDSKEHSNSAISSMSNLTETETTGLNQFLSCPVKTPTRELDKQISSSMPVIVNNSNLRPRRSSLLISNEHADESIRWSVTKSTLDRPDLSSSAISYTPGSGLDIDRPWGQFRPKDTAHSPQQPVRPETQPTNDVTDTETSFSLNRLVDHIKRTSIDIKCKIASSTGVNDTAWCISTKLVVDGEVTEESEKIELHSACQDFSVRLFLKYTTLVVPSIPNETSFLFVPKSLVDGLLLKSFLDHCLRDKQISRSSEFYTFLGLKSAPDVDISDKRDESTRRCTANIRLEAAYSRLVYQQRSLQNCSSNDFLMNLHSMIIKQDKARNLNLLFRQYRDVVSSKYQLKLSVDQILRDDQQQRSEPSWKTSLESLVELVILQARVINIDSLEKRVLFLTGTLAEQKLQPEAYIHREIEESTQSARIAKERFEEEWATIQMRVRDECRTLDL